MDIVCALLEQERIRIERTSNFPSEEKLLIGLKSGTLDVNISILTNIEPEFIEHFNA